MQRDSPYSHGSNEPTCAHFGVDLDFLWECKGLYDRTTVTLCPQMDPPPISPSPIPPPGGWAPLVQRGEGKTSVSWEGEKRVGLILTIRQDGTTRHVPVQSTPRSGDEMGMFRWRVNAARVQVGSQLVLLPNTTPSSFPSFLALGLPGPGVLRPGGGHLLSISLSLSACSTSFPHCSL